MNQSSPVSLEAAISEMHGIFYMENCNTAPFLQLGTEIQGFQGQRLLIQDN